MEDPYPKIIRTPEIRYPLKLQQTPIVAAAKAVINLVRHGETLGEHELHLQASIPKPYTLIP